MSNLEAEVVQAWQEDAELTKAKQALRAKQAELNALKREVHEHENAILAKVKQRLGLTTDLTDFECMLEESRHGIR